MIGQSYYFFDIINTYNTVFGVLFSDLKTKTGNDFKKIEIAQANKSRITQEVFRKEQGVGIILPRLSYSFLNATMDMTRHKNKLTEIDLENGEQYTFNEIPYTFEYELIGYTRTKIEAFQIMEQILPSFQPDVTLNIIHSKELGIKRDVTIVLTGNSIEMNQDNDEADPMNEKCLVTFNFSLYGYLFPSVRDVRFIENIINNVRVADAGALEASNPNTYQTYMDEGL